MALLHVDFYSETLGCASRMEILLPGDIEAVEGAYDRGAPLKTLYLLHGMTDNQTLWQRMTSIERYSNERNLAVVMPTTRLGWYADTPGGENWFEFVTDELIAQTRRMLPQLSHRREDTYVAGLSMGGFGALKCALRCPETFSKAVSLSGAVDALGVTRLPDPLADAHYWADVFGAPEAIPGSANDLFAAAEALKDSALRPKLFMWCGTEDFLYDMNLRMRDHLRALGYELNYSEGHGDHHWVYWDREIQNALDWLLDEKEAGVCR